MKITIDRKHLPVLFSMAVSTVLLSALLSPARAEAAETTERAANVLDFQRSMVQNAPVPLGPSPRADALRSAALEQTETASGAVLDGSDVSVLAQGDGAVVRVGLRGAGVEPISSRSTFFDAHGNATSTVEFAFRADGRGGGSLQVWQDGQSRFSKSITAAETAATMRVAAQDSRASQGFWAKLNDCLAKQNVNAWALAILAGVCAAACVVTAGAACAACVGATIGFPSGVVTACIVIASR
ncbi:hypothetical protein [Curtobacterium sp. MCBA15_012]|uniref:hypothetical protein n=1 Tax=Curtobacterium sp. MCBA15_012 TaxID=1898738 RepID=UPI0008DE8E9B|nr:hypothetical protein [Curtobacterium sp. MCBA15_012]WIA99673.1 hypothetical protein QOL15_14350 [Curtobacterium sp. MCBA15_012]